MGKRIETLDDLEHEARNLLQCLAKPDQGATLVTLSGELGAGKTAFAKAVAKALGIEGDITSPTFVLEKIYALPSPKLGFTRLFHIDAYRLQDGGELAALGFDEAMADPENLILLEWPEQVSDALRTPTARITLSINEDGSRTYTYEG
jgi:tRNA threonylcarbamoyladenosine biosynthesis protein TsaE